MLRTEPRAFTLFAALRALEVLMPDRPRVGTARPSDEGLRLAQRVHLEFAPTEIAGIEEGSRWRLEQFGFGLFGPNGALPLHLTEFIFNRARHHGDTSLTDFVNALQHRWICLFYRAWAASEPAVQADRSGEDEFLKCLRALVGLDAPDAQDSSPLSGAALAARAGLVTPGPRSADGLEILLSDYFRVPIRLRPFVGGWLDIPADALLRLGVDSGGTLGQGATLGSSTWQVSQSFELVIGPVDHDTLLKFLPGTRALEELRELVRLYTNDEWQWRLRLLVDLASVPAARLGPSSRLGQTSWLGGKSGVAADVVLQGDLPPSAAQMRSAPASRTTGE